MQSPPPRSPTLLPGFGARCRVFQLPELQLGAEYDDQLLVAVECMLHFQNAEVNHLDQKIAQLCKMHSSAPIQQTLPMEVNPSEPLRNKGNSVHCCAAFKCRG
ncbi:hypothetical protein [Devosia limi]|uniref:hypothetical protein n=1 Tax=Devosia limi TaxID=288995 RepID=UPI001160937E|nr:hypothetical protein [Devosia limi]